MNKKFDFTKKDLLLVVICCITLFFCNYAIVLYDAYKEHNSSLSIVSNYLTEVSNTEFNSYLIENPQSFTYFGIPGEEESIVFEKELKDTIIRYHLKDKIIYVNAKGVDLNKYKENLKIPAIVYFEEGKFLDYINKDNDRMNSKSIIKFLKLYGDL